MEIAIGIILIIASLFLIVAVLMQSGKNHNLSGTIAGGAESFFGKAKASTMDKKLSKLTTGVAIVFVILVLVSYLMQDTVDYSSLISAGNNAGVTDVDEHDHEADAAGETEAEAAGETEAEAAGETEADAAGETEADAAGETEADAAGETEADAAGETEGESEAAE